MDSDTERKALPLKRILIVAILFIVIFGGGYLVYRNWFAVDAPVGHTVYCKKGTPLEDAAALWFKSLVGQRQRSYSDAEDIIKRYDLKSVEALNDGKEHAAQIGFSLELNDPGSSKFKDWNLDNDSSAEWAVTFSVTDTIFDTTIYTAKRIQRPAAYQLEVYNSSGQAKADELNHELKDEIPFVKADCTYKIEGGKCSLSYDGANTWIETPLPVAKIDNYVSGQFKTNELSKGSYIISPEKTALLYGGFNTPLTCLYSDDMGKTWKTSEPENGKLLYCHIKFVSFPTKNNGYIIVGGNKTMSSEAESVYETTDGGTTWMLKGRGPELTLMVSADFVAKDIGFISYPYMEGAPMLYRTEDGGVSWTPVTLDIDESMRTVFTQPETPVLNGSELVLLIDEGYGGHYKSSGATQLKYVSEDMGKTWTFKEAAEVKSE